MTVSETVTIENRPSQPYVSVAATETMDSIDSVLPALHARLLGRLAELGIAMAGAPFWKYNVIDMVRQLQVEVGVATTKSVPATSDFASAILPSGRYAVTTHVGHPAGLVNATDQLLAWAEQHELRWDMRTDAEGEKWACRLEEYLTDPTEEPDLDQWVTRLAFKLAD